MGIVYFFKSNTLLDIHSIFDDANKEQFGEVMPF
jgi:hypothetical protein